MNNKITPFLWLDGTAVAAKDFYLDVFDDSELLSTLGAGENPMGVTVRLNDIKLTLFNGGPAHKISEAFSLFVNCESQEEVDAYWNKLLAGGGREDQCGWLKDQFGVSWQIVPTMLSDVLGGADPEGRERAMQAMLGMIKLDIAELQRAYDGA